MAFFEPPPPPPPPSEPFRRPEWMRPENILGEAVPLNFVLARTPKVAITVQHITAFPTGFEFEVVAAAKLEDEIWDPMHGLAGFRGRPGQRGGEMWEEILRFGIQYADGSKATSVGPPMIGPGTSQTISFTGPQDERKQGPMLVPQGGSSGGRVSTQRFWAWPVPPSGPLAFVCEWPKYNVALTRHEIDADLIREAAKRAIELWPESDQ